MNLVMDEVRPKDVPCPKVKCDPIRSKRISKMGDRWWWWMGEERD